jgi:hypothetical protein
LDPYLQHQILQKRWLNCLFMPDSYPSFIYPSMIQHLSFFLNVAQYPLLPLFMKSHRKSTIFEKFISIWSTIFTLMDFFIDNVPASHFAFPIRIGLDLPLWQLIQTSPNHWSYRHSIFKAHILFILGPITQHFRYRTENEYSLSYLPTLMVVQYTYINTFR